MSTSASKNTLMRDLTQGSVTKQLLIFSGPLVLSGLLQMIYNMADMVIAGQFVGDIGLSAVSIGGDVLGLLTFVAMGFSSAGQVMISQYMGAGRRDQIRRLIGTMFTLLLGCALVMTVGCVVAREQILSLVNTPAESLSEARYYVTTCILGLVPIYGYNLVSAILRGMGNSKHPFVIIAIASVMNIALDLLFVGVFQMKAFGAALATVIAQTTSFLWALWFLYRNREHFGFDFKLKSFAVDREILGPFIQLGIPMMLQSAAVSFSRLYVVSWVNTYGVTASAVTGVGNKLSMFTGVVAHALSAAGGSMIGQCIGAEKYERVTRVLVISFLFNAVFSTVFSVATVLWPNVVFGMFTSDQSVLEMSLLYVPVAVVQNLGNTLRPPMFGLINGSGNSKLNLAVALLDGIVARIGLALLLGLVFQMGIQGFWYGDALAGTVPFFIGGVYYLSGKWKTNKYLIRS